MGDVALLTTQNGLSPRYVWLDLRVKTPKALVYP